MISAQEFQVLQQQLLELRSLNYKLQEENSKYKNDRVQENKIYNGDATTKIYPFTSINKFLHLESKKMENNKQECTTNSLIQLKETMYSQEMEFKIQQEFMQQEVRKLIARNNELESKMDEMLKKSSSQNDCNKENGEILQTQSSESAKQIDKIASIESENGNKINEQENTIKQEKDENDRLKLDLAKTIELNNALKEKNETIEHNWQTSELTSNNRKMLLEKQAAHLDEIKNEHCRTINMIKKEYDVEIEQLHQQLTKLALVEKDCEMKSNKIDDIQARYNASKNEIEMLNEKVENLQSKLATMQNKCTSMKCDYEERKQKLEASSGNLEKLLEESEMKAQKRVEQAKEQKCVEIEQLKQMLLDKEVNEKAMEKKQQALIKDLKKQANVEKKRADRLGEKLAALVAQRSTSPASFEEVRGMNFASKDGSVSSWQQIQETSKNNKDSETLSSSDSLPIQDKDLDTDTVDLVSKVTALQKDKYDLLEKVHMLQENHALLLDELNTKRNIIKQYITNRRLPDDEQTTSAKLKQRLTEMIMPDQSSNDIHAMNRKLQIMLEETLVKNISLQNDLDALLKKDSIDANAKY